MYADREVFPSSPLVLVAAEIRFTDAPRLRQLETRDAVAIALEERFPIAEQVQGSVLELGPTGPPQVQERVGVVLKDVRSTESVTLLPGSMTYETTRYTTFDDLLGAVTTACDVLVGAKVRPALERVGLRYIDEVRIPESLTDMREWSRWIDPSLTGHLATGPDGTPATGSETLSSFDLGAGRGLTVRSVALADGSVVAPQHLQRSAVPSGPFFVLDFDGYQDYAGMNEAALLSAGAVEEALSAVHAPCGAAFQRSITEAAREHFRKMS